jgi:H+/Cl- antiporter ClcA
VIRWLRLIATATVILSLIGLGVIAGLFLVANSGWVPVKIPPWLQGVFNDRPHDVWLPALIAGWLASAILLAALALGSMFYVWRRRQYESLITKLEKELAKLRNLPFEQPAPFEDLPEMPSAQAARVMSALDDDDGLGSRRVND